MTTPPKAEDVALPKCGCGGEPDAAQRKKRGYKRFTVKCRACGIETPPLNSMEKAIARWIGALSRPATPPEGLRERIIDNLAAILRRMIWTAKKETGDTGMKVLAGNANELLKQYGLEGNLLRNKPTIAADALPGNPTLAEAARALSRPATPPEGLAERIRTTTEKLCFDFCEMKPCPCAEHLAALPLSPAAQAVPITDNIAQAYLDGWDACAETVNSIKSSAWWAPDVAPEDAYQRGIDCVKRIINKSRPSRDAAKAAPQEVTAEGIAQALKTYVLGCDPNLYSGKAEMAEDFARFVATLLKAPPHG